jgi:PD-(D/E)XK endonuclease
VQCKWGRLRDGVITAHVGTCRHTPRNGYVRTTYSADEIDAVAIWCEQLRRAYVPPIVEVAGKSYLHLRLTAAKNNQAKNVKWAAQYELGAIAQLGERRTGSAKVAGSSPASSTPSEAA